MPYYQDTNNELHFLSDVDIANGGLSLLPAGCIAITDAQAGILQKPSAAQIWSDYQANAKIALDEADTTMLRVQEAVALGANTATSPDVVVFVNYRRALRAILKSQSGDATQPLPTKPAYPAGT